MSKFQEVYVLAQRYGVSLGQEEDNFFLKIKKRRLRREKDSPSPKLMISNYVPENVLFGEFFNFQKQNLKEIERKREEKTSKDSYALFNGKEYDLTVKRERLLLKKDFITSNCNGKVIYK